MVMLAPIAGIAGATMGANTGTTTPQTASLDDDELYSVTDNISVWERSALTLRADPTTGDPVSVDFTVDLNGPDGEPVNFFREELAVYKAGETVTVNFGTHLTDTSELAGEEVQILTAELNEDVTADDVNLSMLPTSADGLTDELTQENLDNLNENVSFSLKHDVELDENGELEHEFTADRAGLYTIVVATGDGLAVDNGDLDIVGDTTIVGAESLAAQESPSDVTVDDDDLLPGDTVSFDATADELDGDIDHAVVLYDEETLTSPDNFFVINITEEIDEDFSESDIQIEHDIATVNGVHELENDVTVMGQTLGAQSVSGQTHLGDVIDFVTSEAGDAAGEDLEGPTSIATDDVVLNASSTALANVGPSATIDVETYGNWTPGEYRWIHVASGDSSDEFQTSTGTISLGETAFDVKIDEDASTTEVETDETATIVANVTNVGDLPAETPVELTVDGDFESDTTVDLDVDETETVEFDVTRSDEGEYTVTVTAAEASDSITLTVDDPSPPPIGPPAPPGPPDDPPEPGPPEEVPGDVYSEHAVAEFDEKAERMVATFTQDSPVSDVTLDTADPVEVLVQEFDAQNLPKELPRTPGAQISLQRIALSPGYELTEGTIRFTQPADAFSSAALEEEALTAYRFDEDTQTWEPLETTVLEVTDDRVTVEADTPRFSYFAVAETRSPTAVIDVSPDTTVEAGETQTLSATDSDPGSGEIDEYEWRLDGEYLSDEPEVEQTLEEGTYEVELTVTNDAGNSDTVTETLTVEEEDEPEDPPVDPPEDETYETEIVVTDSDGEPIAGATVEIDGETYTTDENGVVTVELEDGEYTATITADGYEEMTQDITVDGQDVAISTELATVEEDDGTSWLTIVLVLILLAVLAGVGYFVYVEYEDEIQSFIDEKRQ
ncbi:carboxypeptidase regulatory-like domain-containing protein [Natrialbaceae archaeon A-CW2]